MMVLKVEVHFTAIKDEIQVNIFHSVEAMIMYTVFWEEFVLTDFMLQRSAIKADVYWKNCVLQSFKKISITTALRTNNITKKLFRQKPDKSSEQKTGIYKLICDEYKKFYIGQQKKHSIRDLKNICWKIILKAIKSLCTTPNWWKFLYTDL